MGRIATSYQNEGNPSFTFKGDLDTGIYHNADNEIGVACSGHKVCHFSPSGMTMASGSEIYDYIGSSGFSGISGATGPSGLSGTSGYSGVSGDTGPSGYSGISGTDGTSGTSGLSGISGTSGTSGYSGTSGISGTSGTSGYSGSSGTSGYSGTSGSVGPSGFSGTAPSSPTFTNVTISSLSDNLPVFTDVNMKLISKTESDTRTALGLGTADSPLFQRLHVSGGRSYFGANNETLSIGIGYNEGRVGSGHLGYIGVTDSAQPDIYLTNAAGIAVFKAQNSGDCWVYGVCSANGIKFPASQVASSDANTLDDYEEGTWTPTLNGFTVTGTPTYTGKYTKIGNTVFIFIRLTTSGGTISYSAGNTISNLTFSTTVAGCGTVGLGGSGDGGIVQFVNNSCYMCGASSSTDIIISGSYQV